MFIDKYIKDMKEGNELYVLYLLDVKGRPCEINGPFFYDEISAQKPLLYDTEDEDPLIMQQVIFRDMYEEEYIEFFEEFWFECINGFLTQNTSWIGEYNYDPAVDSIYNEWFVIYPCDNDSTALHISFGINADPFRTGRLFKELVEYSEMTILIDEPFFEDPITGKSYIGPEAARKSIAQEAISRNSLN